MLSFYDTPSPLPFNQQHYQTNFNENYQEKFIRENENYEEKFRRENVVHNDEYLKQKILLEIQRRLPLVLTSKLNSYIQKFNEISKMHQSSSAFGDQPYQATTPPPSPPPQTTTTPTTTLTHTHTHHQQH